jgi:hypothetical protein
MAKETIKKVAKKAAKKVAKKTTKKVAKKVTKKTAEKSAAPAKKVAKTTKKKVAVKKPVLPKALLTTWLKGREGWNDLEWWQLLEHLRAEGHSFYADTQEGRDLVSAFLKEKSTARVKLPTALLDAWLKGRSNWNHDEWLGLLK